MLVVALDPMWPCYFFYPGGCITYDDSTGGFLLALGGTPLFAASVPVNAAGLVLAALLVTSAARRPRPSSKRALRAVLQTSRTIAESAVTVLFLSTLLFSCAQFTAQCNDGTYLIAPFLFISLVMTAVGGVLFMKAFGARGWRRWGFIVATWTALATTRTAFVFGWTLEISRRIEVSDLVYTAVWHREWGVAASAISLVMLFLLSAVAIWRSRG